MTWSTQQQSTTFTTAGGLIVTRTVTNADRAFDVAELAARLDTQRGCLFTSQSEVPGRYRRYDLGFADPPLALVAKERTFDITALNQRGDVLIAFLGEHLAHPDLVIETRTAQRLAGHVPPGPASEDESERTRRASIFTLVRALIALFASPEDRTLGLYGAFGYDLVFQMEDLQRRLTRANDQRDLVLYLPDDIVVTDHAAQVSARMTYDFAFCPPAGKRRSTAGHPRATPPSPYATNAGHTFSDHQPGDYQAIVRKAQQAFARGDLFEAVPGQLFGEPCAAQPSAVFNHLARINPAPYGALINLGAGEFLVSASPEMFVRSDGRRIETCPISGTIARGADVLADAEQIRRLLNSAKDEFELNMCTDVDRNDKARICEPGSVQVIGRRQIEVYSKLIHTVDHVEGRLRAQFDALDAFLSHAWAVTVTGAPKIWAMQFVEDNEKSPRRWYGAAIGGVAFDGGMNTGLTIRTIRMAHGTAEIRVGATLLFDSDPAAEEEECNVKIAAMRQALREAQLHKPAAMSQAVDLAAGGAKILLVDCEDSFVHTLADYARQTGADVTVVRHDRAVAVLARDPTFDLVLLSPGPGRPTDFKVATVIEAALAQNKAIFGVCLGMQALGEYFGGRLGQLPIPAHGRPARIETRAQSKLFEGLPSEITIGRYHSLFIEPLTMPADLIVTAATADGIPMAVEHRTRPIAAVQFHPESIMSLEGGVGLKILRNALAMAVRGMAVGQP